jgi:phage-related protein
MSFYDRDRNITGVATLTGFTFSPEYGSTATFETKTNYFPFSDRTANNVSAGLNTVIGRYGLKLQLRETEAQQLINFYESQSGSGIFAVSDGSNIYRTLSGSIEDLQFSTQNNGKYNIDLSFDVERNASPLKWSGQSFVNHSFSRWESGVSFAQDDVVYFEHDLEEPTNNFFYCSTNHLAAPSNHPLSTGQKWTANLFAQPNEQFTVQTKPLVAKNQFKGSFSQRIKDQKNIHSLDALEFSYKNISDKKTKAILHFLEGRLGYKKFEYQSPEIYNRPKTFFAPTWNHQWNYKDSNNLTISAAEDPFGMLVSGKPNLYLAQESGYSSLNVSISGQEKVFFDTGNGKELAESSNLAFLWPNTGARHQVKFYGRLVGITGSGQGLVKAQINTSSRLTHLNLSGNSIATLNLYEATRLQSLNCANNNIGGFDLVGQSGLVFADISNNFGGYINISGCENLTGLYAGGNRFPSTYVDGALESLVNAGKYSGYANFSGSSGISPSSLSYVSTLTGRFWNLGYEYSPIPSTTTLIPSTTTVAPPAYWNLSGLYGTGSSDACPVPTTLPPTTTIAPTTTIIPPTTTAFLPTTLPP